MPPSSPRPPGITPYPSDVKGQPNWAAQVVVTPAALLTLGDAAGAGSAADKYDAAYKGLGVEPRGGLYGAGMISSDPQARAAALHALCFAVPLAAAACCVVGDRQLDGPITLPSIHPPPPAADRAPRS